MVGSVIQATRTFELMDGLWIENQLKARNSLQWVCTIPGVLTEVVCTSKLLQGQTEFCCAEVGVTAWCQAKCQV